MSDMPAELEAIVGRFPNFWAEAGHLFTQTLYDESRLDRKTIELILCSLLAYLGWRTGLEVHARQARLAGATSDEVRGAVLLTFAVGATRSAAPALDWLEGVLD